MIEFNDNVNELLPYDRKQYISRKKWYGVSFQLPGVFEGKDIGLVVYQETYEDWFKNIITKFDNGHSWIINHDYIDEDWFPNDEDNLISLRTLFKQNNIPNLFKGALIFTVNDLLRFGKDLISYPYAVFNETGLLYNNLDISNSKIQLVIKISGHLNIDLLSPDICLLRKIVNENNSNIFTIKQYRGTKL